MFVKFYATHDKSQRKVISHNKKVFVQKSDLFSKPLAEYYEFFDSFNDYSKTLPDIKIDDYFSQLRGGLPNQKELRWN